MLKNRLRITKRILKLKKLIEKDGSLNEQEYNSKSPSQRGKLFITEIGKMVNEYIDTNFNNISSYSFTSEINNKLDLVSNGDVVWHNLVNNVYKSFIDKVDALSSQENIIKTKEFIINKKKLIGQNEDYQFYAYRDKYGVVVLKQKDNEIIKKTR